MMKLNKLQLGLVSICFCIGITLISYPYISKLYYQKILPNMAYTYHESVQLSNQSDVDYLFEQAMLYNEFLVNQYFPYRHQEQEYDDYLNQLRLEKNDIMGVIEIECIDVLLPIYHGVESNVLEMGIGHLPYSTLPIGGQNSHCVLLGHTGLSNKILFTHLSKLVQGDIINITVLGEQFEYVVVDQVVVLPNEIDNLKVQEGKDLLSLVTCTPYGINSHRLIIQSMRV